MSNSRRHTPIFGIAAGASEKDCKRRYNRNFRRKNRAELSDKMKEMSDTGAQFERYAPVDIKEVSNPWAMVKDGKVYRIGADNIDMVK